MTPPERVVEGVEEFDDSALRMGVRDVVVEPDSVSVILKLEECDRIRAPVLLADAPMTPVGVGVPVREAVGLLVADINW